MNKIKNLCVHHSAVSIKVQPIQLVAVNNYHKQLYGMKSSLGYYVGYHYLLEGNGKLIQTRNDQEESAAVVGHNKDTLSVCLTGNFDAEMPTQAQINKLRSWLYEKMKLWGLEVSDIYDHRELQKNRTCPGCLIPKGWGRMLVSPIPPSPFDQKKQDGLIRIINKPVGILGKVDKSVAKKRGRSKM